MALDRGLDRSHLVVKLFYLRSHYPIVRIWDELEYRVQHCSQWYKNYDRSLDKRGKPEGEILLQKRPAGFVETLRFVAQRKIDRLRSGEFSSFLKDSGLRVDFDGRCEQ